MVRFRLGTKRNGTGLEVLSLHSLLRVRLSKFRVVVLGQNQYFGLNFLNEGFQNGFYS